MATFNVNEFTSKFKGGGARPNLFKVRLSSLPNAVSERNGVNDFEFFCKSVSGIPASTIGAIEVPYFCRTIKFAGDREIGELTTTIINEEDMQVRNILDSWVNGLNGMINNRAGSSLGTRTEFTTSLSLHTYRKVGVEDQKWVFEKCWPSMVSSIDLNWDSTNTLQEYTVTWQYDTYKHDKAF